MSKFKLIIFVDTPIYFPSNEEAIVNIDHDYSILPSVTNSLASISISFSHFQDKVKQQFEEINKPKLKVTNLQVDIETHCYPNDFLLI